MLDFVDFEYSPFPCQFPIYIPSPPFLENVRKFQGGVEMGHWREKGQAISSNCSLYSPNQTG